MPDAFDQAVQLYGNTPAQDPLAAGMDAFIASKPMPRPVPKAEPTDPGVWNVFKNAVVKGAAGFGDMIPNAITSAANLGIAAYGVGKHELTRSNDLPDLIPGDALNGWNKLGRAADVIKDANEPTTGAQRVVDFTGQVLGGGGINPRTMAANIGSRAYLPLARDLVTPVAGGIAGGLTREAVSGLDPDTWYGRLAGAALPAAAQFGGSYPTARMSTAAERASQTTRNVTPEQWQAANELAQRAAALGAPLTAPEAIQAVAGNNPGLQSLQRVTEQSTAGVNTIAPLMAQRPGQNQALFDRVGHSIYPNEMSPDTIAGNLRNSAAAAIDEARRQGNIRANPYYATSSNNPAVTIPPHDWNALTSDPAVAWALGQTKQSPLLGVQGAQPGSLQWLDTAKKFLDSHSNSEQQRGNHFPATQAANAAALITGAIDPIAPDYARARAIVAANMRDNVEPMQAGQVGKLANTDNFVTQANTLLPESPMDVTPSAINRTAQTINAQDPDILRRFAAQYLRGTFNEANQNTQGGANQFGGARFAAKVAGNDMQASNLQQLLESSGAQPRGLLDALDVWKAQGTRPSPGSATTFNNGEVGLLSGGGGLLSMVGRPLSAPGLLADKIGYSLSTKDLAKTIAPSGMSVERFQALARANGAYSPAQQAAFAAMLRASAAGSQAPQAAQQ